MSFSAGTITELSKKMESLGVSEGGSNRPDAAAESPDLNEIKVIAQAKKHIELEESSRIDVFVEVEKKAYDIEQKIDTTHSTCNSLLENDLIQGAFHSALSKEEQNLIAACAKEMEARAALNSFKTRKQIQDPAHYPQDQLLHFSLLILFIAIETAVNSFFYQGATGLLGGAVVALSVSVVNMSIAASLGSMYRYVNLPETKEKITGYFGLILFILLAIVLNLIFSTFRVQYEILQTVVLQENLPEPTTAMLVTAFKTAVADAFRVFIFEFPDVDVMSFILFFIGFMCSIVAFWKGYTHDDKHPHYGKMDRIHKDAESQFKEAKSKAFDIAIETVHKISDEIEVSRDALISAQRNTGALKAQIQGAQASYEGNIRKIQSELELVIEAYRGANKATRATSAPQYFSEKPNVVPNKGMEKHDFLIEKINILSEKSKNISDEKVSLLNNKLNEVRSKINQLVQAEFQKFLSEIVEKATITLRANGQVQFTGTK